MKFPLVRELAAEGVPVAVTCRVMGLLEARPISSGWLTLSAGVTGMTRT